MDRDVFGVRRAGECDGKRDERCEMAQLHAFPPNEHCAPPLPACGEREKQNHALAYFPRLKNRSLSSSEAVSRFDLMVPVISIIFFTAGRAAIVSNQRLRFGFASHFTPMLSWLRVHGKVAMSAIVYSSPPRYWLSPSRFSSTS